MKLDKIDKIFFSISALALIAVGYGFYCILDDHYQLQKKYDILEQSILTQRQVEDSIRSLEIDISRHKSEIVRDSSIINELKESYLLNEKTTVVTPEPRPRHYQRRNTDRVIY